MKNVEQILRSPVLVFTLSALGIAVGLLQLPFVSKLNMFGDIFLALLELCMLPIVATMLTTSIHKVLRGIPATPTPRWSRIPTP